MYGGTFLNDTRRYDERRVLNARNIDIGKQVSDKSDTNIQIFGFAKKWYSRYNVVRYSGG